MGKMILVDEDFFNDRCKKATGRLIRLYKIQDTLKLIIDGADNLDKWNGFGDGYVYVREEIEDMIESLSNL